MPRRARNDAPGALHHIICRGLNAIGTHQSSLSRAVEREQRLASEKHLLLEVETNA